LEAYRGQEEILTTSPFYAAMTKYQLMSLERGTRREKEHTGSIGEVRGAPTQPATRAAVIQMNRIMRWDSEDRGTKGKIKRIKVGKRKKNE
jgi:hypothetical protein